LQLRSVLGTVSRQVSGDHLRGAANGEHVSTAVIAGEGRDDREAIAAAVEVSLKIGDSGWGQRT
jgi:hypothetical protein